jgi:hypothetical protein
MPGFPSLGVVYNTFEFDTLTLFLKLLECQILAKGNLNVLSLVHIIGTPSSVSIQVILEEGVSC